MPYVGLCLRHNEETAKALSFGFYNLEFLFEVFLCLIFM